MWAEYIRFERSKDPAKAKALLLKTVKVVPGVEEELSRRVLLSDAI